LYLTTINNVFNYSSNYQSNVIKLYNIQVTRKLKNTKVY